MFLFIFESIGTSELVLIGIIALVFLGPRKLPEMARKLGKIMADFRNTTNEFKETWEREVNFEEETRALRTGDLDETPVPRETRPAAPQTENIATPEVKEIDARSFNKAAAESESTAKDEPVSDDTGDSANTSLSDKKSWL